MIKKYWQKTNNYGKLNLVSVVNLISLILKDNDSRIAKKERRRKRKQVDGNRENFCQGK